MRYKVKVRIIRILPVLVMSVRLDMMTGSPAVRASNSGGVPLALTKLGSAPSSSSVATVSLQPVRAAFLRGVSLFGPVSLYKYITYSQVS